MPTDKKHLRGSLEKLCSVVHKLRKECPWDRKQTHLSLIPYLIEETYEIVDAIEGKDFESLREELGDLLLQIVLHCEIASERKHFDIGKVSDQIRAKMIRRHPHIFGKQKVLSMKQHLSNWSRIKQEEKPKKGLLEGIPRSMPALQMAQRYGEIAASVGFDWKRSKDVLSKIREEILETERALKSTRADEKEMEFGDLLFSLAQWSRHLGIDSERALRKSSQKFAKRFAKLDARFKLQGKDMRVSSQRLEKEWERIKHQSTRRKRAPIP